MENLEIPHFELKIKTRTKWIISIIMIFLSLYLLKPFIINQIVLKGDGYLSYGIFKDAERQYKKALFFNPNLMETWNWLGYAYKQGGKTQKAIETYKKAIEINPINMIAYHDLGMIYMFKKDFETAKEYLQEASLIGPEHKQVIGRDYTFYHVSSLRALSICQEKLGEIESAIKTNERILEYYPEDKTAKERIKRLKKR